MARRLPHFNVIIIIIPKGKKILKAKHNLLLSILIEREQISPPSSPCN